MKLYVYDHCPYCVKARMIFGLKHLPFELIMLLNDDEATPISMVGKKMVPILQKDDATFMPESMDIVHYIDQLNNAPILANPTTLPISVWLKTINDYLSRLLMPRYAQANLAEFATVAARQYYIHKKEALIGSFDVCLIKSPALIETVNRDLQVLDKLIVTKEACNGALSVDDIHLFAVLRGLSIVKGIKYPAQVEAYRQNMAQLSGVQLFDRIAL